MAHDDRDRNFEKALARQLRSSSSSGVEANALAGAPLVTCPDPEILAAYHDQSLSPDELNSWKQHVVACSHCQFVLVQLAATENIALDVSPAQDPLLVSEPAISRKQRDYDSRFVNGVRRPPSWRWVLLIPAGAIAASLVAWISLRRSIPLPVSPSSTVQVAENQPAPPPPTSPSPALAPPRERAKKEKNQAVGGIAGAASLNRDQLALQSHDQAQVTQQAANQRAANTPHGPSVTLQKQQQQELSRITVGAAAAPVQNQLDKKAASGAATTARAQESLTQPAPPPPPPPPQSSFVADGTVSAPLAAKISPPAPTHAANPAAPKTQSGSADGMAASSEAIEVSAEPQTDANVRAMKRAAVLQNPHVFAAPDARHLWRLGPAGSLEFSNDKGEKWKPQVSGVDTDLLSGSAASARVAWIVGRSGTILRTTDGGAHWTKVNSPVTSDLAGVRAIDAFHATISVVADPQTGVIKTYATADGGATWSPIPLE